MVEDVEIVDERALLGLVSSGQSVDVDAQVLWTWKFTNGKLSSKDQSMGNADSRGGKNLSRPFPIVCENEGFQVSILFFSYRMCRRGRA